MPGHEQVANITTHEIYQNLFFFLNDKSIDLEKIVDNVLEWVSSTVNLARKLKSGDLMRGVFIYLY